MNDELLYALDIFSVGFSRLFNACLAVTGIWRANADQQTLVRSGAGGTRKI